MKILITSGGTKVPIDRVRSITNMSSGNFGSKIASEFLKLGHDIVFMKAKGSKTPMTLHLDLYELLKNKSSVDTVAQKMTDFITDFEKTINHYMEYEYTTYDQYAEMLKFVIGVEQPDIIVLAAAVSDYGVENYVNGKIRSNDVLSIKLKQLPKLINRVKEWAKPEAKLIGFKLLVDSKPSELLAAAQRSVLENGCDMVVANDLQDIKDNNHKLQLVFKNGVVRKFEAKEDKDNPHYLAQVVVQQILQSTTPTLKG